MRHVRMLGLCLVAVLAVAAYAVSSASALPEWGKCEAKAGGKYSDANCTVKAKKGSGAYEWKKGTELANVPFTGHNVGAGGVLYAEFGECAVHTGTPQETLLRSTRQRCNEEGGKREHNGGGPVIECTAESNSGEASGKSSIKNVHVTFTGCLLLGGVPCQNTATPGEIKTNELKGELGYINKAGKKVGVLLEPAKKNGAFAEFECPGFEIDEVVGVGNSKEGAAHTSSGCDQECPGATPTEEKHGGYDGVISPIEPVNQMTSTYTQEYKVINGEAGANECVENTPTSFQGKHIDVLEHYAFLNYLPTDSYMWSCAGEEITNVNTPTEAGEIKA